MVLAIHSLAALITKEVIVEQSNPDVVIIMSINDPAALQRDEV